MKAIRLFKRIGPFGFCLLLATQLSASAEQTKGDSIPPVEQASFHQLIFADEDIAVLNNLYPPGGDSGFHTHYRDLFAVIIQPSQSSGQALGKPLTPAPAYAAGTAVYSAVESGPRTHRVVNGEQGEFQIIVVELRRPKPLGDAVSSRVDAPQYERILDNPRMRAWRLILAPGQSAASVSQGGKGVRVVVRGGLLTTQAPGVPDQVLALRPGDFSVQPAEFTRALANHGTKPSSWSKWS